VDFYGLPNASDNDIRFLMDEPMPMTFQQMEKYA
jgi:hypothetical protein